MLNSFNAIGRLVADVEVKQTAKGNSISTVKIAIQRDRKGPNGESEADFLPVVVFNQSAEYLAKWATKGDLISVSGRIQTRNYENQQGQRIYVTEVISNQVQIVGKSQGNQGQQNQGGQNISNQQGDYDYFGGSPVNLDDSDLPF